ncbi:MAG: elongation factor P maturation arginine rhamnosyltransferase EarP, partial [Neisseriaceae bacterium]|nr:elongation factor P maturation arginine rhamnosyltransferase EarP [Neisseriaceae bacterium]
MKMFLFCRVIDNFGDIAVSWRLAQQLAQEYGAEVTLVSDQMAVFAQLDARVCAQVPSQMVAGIQIFAWLPEWEDNASVLLKKGWPQVLIEMFSCRLPVAYERALSQHSPRLVWLAVDYLSAESWVESYHALPSPQSGGMVKYFFFPGFNAKTGGLFCEADLMAHVLAEKSDVEQGNPLPLTLYGMNRRSSNELWISLFAYEPLILPAWVTFLSERNRPVTLFVPRGRV